MKLNLVITVLFFVASSSVFAKPLNRKVASDEAWEITKATINSYDCSGLVAKPVSIKDGCVVVVSGSANGNSEYYSMLLAAPQMDLESLRPSNGKLRIKMKGWNAQSISVEK